jgi:hypothetical protein
VSLQPGFEGAEPLRPQRLEQLELRIGYSSHMATGTLACPSCDAPVHPGPLPLSPSAALGCPFCSHAGVARDFLSLAPPSRPARVEVRVIRRTRRSV